MWKKQLLNNADTDTDIDIDIDIDNPTRSPKAVTKKISDE